MDFYLAFKNLLGFLYNLLSVAALISVNYCLAFNGPVLVLLLLIWTCFSVSLLPELKANSSFSKVDATILKNPIFNYSPIFREVSSYWEYLQSAVWSNQKNGTGDTIHILGLWVLVVHLLKLSLITIPVLIWEMWGLVLV